MFTYNQSQHQGIEANIAKLPHLSINPTQGLWNIGGFNLPDFGLSEFLGVGQNNAATYPSYGALDSSNNTYTKATNTDTGITNPSVLYSTSGAKAPSGITYNSTGVTSGNQAAQVSRVDQLRQIANEGGLNPAQQTELNSLQEQTTDQYAQVRNEIASAWDNYLNSLGEQSQYIDEQKTAQEGIANTQYQKGETTISSQKANSLKDIYKVTRNAFQAGNNYLGQLGASDSSAAGMLNYAINKQQLQQIGDLNNFTNTQLQQLAFDRDMQLQGIQQWFAQSQQQLKQQRSQGLLQKGTDMAQLSRSLLDQAVNATQQVRANAMNQQNALLSWAMSNSNNLNQLRSNIAGISNAYNPGQIQLAGYNQNKISYGGTNNNSNERTDIFGNIISNV